MTALDSGAPLTPTGEQWTCDDMLALAGACLFGAESQGPGAWGQEEIDFVRNLYGAVMTYAKLFRMAVDQEFQAEFGDHVLALASLEGEDPDITVQLVSKGPIS